MDAASDQSDINGGILGDDYGLGKTLQTLLFYYFRAKRVV